MILNYVPRVTQLDAIQLDNQVEELFKQLLNYSTKYLKPGFFEPFLPEIDLLLRTWIFKYTIYNKRSTFGQDILSLNYKRDNFSNSKVYWYFGYTIGLRYLKDRALFSLTSNVSVQNFLYKMEIFHVVGEILNFLRFIQSGKHPKLIDFLLGLDISAEKLTREDLTDFSWTRELLWNNFIELIGTAISLINVFGLKRKLNQAIKYGCWKRQNKIKNKVTEATMTAKTICASCKNKPVLPYTMGCCHIFCYYCLMANKTADQDYTCPKCNYNGNYIKRYLVF
ncbi:unnamed protein product [Chilo suppressalis]|uniref:RING-type E3 ubiquitin transferase (cysteine targeting) n=1 Tax=Chilo suppressalis TaxID=168631 RepID=A0ABN8BFA5_CHISP|nr:unnamed protein product [Chilo suppressalis]